MSDKETVVLEYPGLDTIDMSNEDLQKDLIRKGVAVGVPGSVLVFTKPVKMVAKAETKEV